MAITQSIETQVAYLKRGLSLWKRAAHQYNSPIDQLSPLSFIDWIEALLPNLKPASRRQYIASIKALLNHLSKLNTPDIKEAIKKANQMQSFDYINQHSTKQKRNTSSQKAKKIKRSEIVHLYKKTAHLKGKWVKPSLIWLTANLLVGLRPIEWRKATLIEEDTCIMLVVANAKNTNGRSHGKQRQLNITTLDQHELNIIKAHLKFIKQFVDDLASWNRFYNGVRHTLKIITRKYLPKQAKYPTLYTTRHQFIANAKSQGLLKAEIAALVGHATDETATMHYGKKRDGTGHCFVKPHPNEVLRIKIKKNRQSCPSFRSVN